MKKAPETVNCALRDKFKGSDSYQLVFGLIIEDRQLNSFAIIEMFFIGILHTKKNHLKIFVRTLNFSPIKNVNKFSLSL